MRILAIFPVLASLACSGPDRPLEPAAGLTSSGTPAVHAAQATPTGGAGSGSVTDLNAAPPLSDDELDRLLDALEQQLDKK